MTKLYFDGGCQPNPGKMEIMCVFENGQTFHAHMGQGTNNIAEWSALLYGLYRASEMGETHLEIYGDSKLVVNQANGEWKVSDPLCRALYEDYLGIVKAFKKVEIHHVLRDANIAGIALEQLQNQRKKRR